MSAIAGQSDVDALYWVLFINQGIGVFLNLQLNLLIGNFLFLNLLYSIAYS